MKISTQSWHYRLINLLDWSPPASLCAYFWVVVAALLLVPMYAIGALLAAVFLSAPLWWTFADGAGPIAFIGAVADVALLTVLLFHLVTERRWRERHARIVSGEIDPYTRKPERKPSLLREWLRAKHEKVCPMLEFERP